MRQYETQSEKLPSKGHHHRKHSGPRWGQHNHHHHHHNTSGHRAVLDQQPGGAADRRRWKTDLCDCTRDMKTCEQRLLDVSVTKAAAVGRVCDENSGCWACL